MKKLNWETEEILKYEELGENYWHQGFFKQQEVFDGYYRRNMEELKLRDIALFTLGPVEAKSVIDIGCGDGLYSLTFLKLGAGHVAGQDISESSLQKATAICARNGYTNFTFKAGDCQQLQFADNTFDLAFSGDVFEHISDDVKINFINEAYRVLKPGGLFTIKTPNKSYLQLSLRLQRIKAVFRFKNPFKIYIPFTHNNPNNEHHGLTTIKHLRKLFKNTMFHEPVIIYSILGRKGIPLFIRKWFVKSKYFNTNIIITVRKSYFHGLYY